MYINASPAYTLQILQGLALSAVHESRESGTTPDYTPCIRTHLIDSTEIRQVGNGSTSECAPISDVLVLRKHLTSYLMR